MTHRLWMISLASASLFALCAGGGCGDEASPVWTACPGCVIEGGCYLDGTVNPAQPCEVCDLAASPDAWVSAEGAFCDDGNFCNGVDSCAASACAVHAGDPCADDGAFCNGAESCDEEGEACLHAGDPCGDDGLYCNGAEGCDEAADACSHTGTPCAGGAECLEDDDACCAPEDHQTCDADGDVVWVDSCGREGALVEDCVAAAAHGACSDARCGCQAGWSGAGCATSCLLRVHATGGSDAADGQSWATALRTLDRALVLAAAHSNSCEIWLSEGVFQSGAAGGFPITGQLQIYGGFNGYETAREERVPADNVTHLAGLTNPAVTATAAEGALLDGLTIDGGSTNPAVAGAIAVQGGRLILADVTIAGAGPASALTAQSADLTIEGGWIQGDSGRTLEAASSALVLHGARLTGGTGAHVSGGSLAVVEGLFEEATVSALHLDATDPVTIDASLFANNSTAAWGAGLRVTNAPLVVLTGTEFSGNTAPHGGGVGIDGPATALELTGCTFQANQAPLGGAGVDGAAAGSLRVTGCDFVDNVGHALWTGPDTIVSGGTFTGTTVGRALLASAGQVTIGDGALFQGNHHGAVQWDGATDTLTIADASFVDNAAGDTTDDVGGAILATAGPFTVTGSTFTGNVAGCQGGAIWAADAATVTASTFGGNRVQCPADLYVAWGGASIWTAGGTITGSTFTDHDTSGPHSEWVSLASGSIVRSTVGRVATLAVEDCTFAQNRGRAASYGLAIGMRGTTTTPGQLIIRRSRFHHNVYHEYGLISSVYGSTTIEDSTFERNASAGTGQPTVHLNYPGTVVRNSVFARNHATIALSIQEGSVVNCTFVDNTGAGVDVWEGTVSNSILWNNNAFCETPPCPQDDGYPGSVYSHSIVQNLVDLTGGNLNVDPQLVSDGFGANHAYMYDPSDPDSDWTSVAEIWSIARGPHALSPGVEYELNFQPLEWYAVATPSTEWEPSIHWTFEPPLDWAEQVGNPGEAFFMSEPFTMNLRPAAGSPCIDAADPATATANDIEGLGRVGTADIGAHEYRP